MTVPIRRLFQQLISSFFLLRIVRGYKSRTSLIKIRAAQAYVHGVKKTRVFFLAALFVSVAFVFLVNGLSLIQAAFFTYSMWSNEMKFAAALLIGGIEFLGAIGILIYLFKEETWGKFSGIQKVVNSVIDEEERNK
jgi:hypothetical protein